MPALVGQLSEIELRCLADESNCCVDVPDAGELHGYAVGALLLDNRLRNAIFIDSLLNDCHNAFYVFCRGLVAASFVDKVGAAAEIQTEPHPQSVVAGAAIAYARRISDQHLRQCEEKYDSDESKPDQVSAVH